MHEVSICEGILKMLEEEIPEEEWNDVVEIHLKAGVLSNIEPLILAPMFKRLTSESSFGKANLVIQQIDILAECETCGHSFKVAGYRFICPQCESPTGKILEGKELQIYKIIFEKQLLVHEEANQ